MRRLWVVGIGWALAIGLLTTSGCSSTPRDETPPATALESGSDEVSAPRSDDYREPDLPYGERSPSGDWIFGEELDDTTLPVLSTDESVVVLLELPRLQDLTFVGWGPTQIAGDEVVWVYSADVGSGLWTISPDGASPVLCPPDDLEKPTGWPAEAPVCRDQP